MSRPSWKRVRPILEEVLDLPPEEREPRTVELSEGDSALAEEVMRLVRLEDESGHEERVQLLEDTAFCAAFFAENQASLRRAYDHCVALCERHGVPYHPADAGLYVWIDLREFLAAPGDAKAERALFHAMLDEAKVLLTPGTDCHAASAGFFRCCYAWVSDAAREEAFRRLAPLLGDEGHLN